MNNAQEFIAFLAIGANDASRGIHGGHLETISNALMHSSRMMAYSARLERESNASEDGFSGVYAYEVPEVLGQWIVEDDVSEWPLIRAKLAELFLSCYAGVTLEIRPCSSSLIDGLEHVEETSEDEAQFWGLYVAKDNGPYMHLRDYPTKAKAQAGKVYQTARLCRMSHAQLDELTK